MKTSKSLPLVLGTAGVLASAAASGQAQDNQAHRFYVGIDAGPVWQQGIDLRDSGGEDITFDIGYRAGLKGGYTLTPRFAVELQGGYIANGVDEFGGYEVDDVEMIQTPILFNAVYTLPLGSRFEQQFGAGLGPVFSTLIFDDAYIGYDIDDDVLKNGEGDIVLDGSDTDITLGYQLFAATVYKLSEHARLALGYKFMGTTDHEWEVEDMPNIEAKETMSHTVFFSFTWTF
jgi:hypothetical protein